MKSYDDFPTYNITTLDNDRRWPCTKQRCCCPPGPPGPPGADGISTLIMGSYETFCDLVIAHPIGTKGEAYLVEGELYVWNEEAGEFGKWESVGNLQGPPGPQGEPGPFLSSYIEAVANAQVVGLRGDVVFDTDADILDVAGNDIELESSGSTFIIKRPGLYSLEWSINIALTTHPVTIGLLENGSPMSALSTSSFSGNHSSGALINVSVVPYRICLRNFSEEIAIENAPGFENTAGSLRLLRFADGPAY